MKVLRTGVGTDRYTLMNRSRPGTVLPKHYHHGEVHAWTIEGTWGYLEYDWSATAGDYIYEPAGSIHTLAVPEDSAVPAVVQFVIEKGLDFLDDDGNAFHVENAETITQLYVDTPRRRRHRAPRDPSLTSAARRPRPTAGSQSFIASSMSRRVARRAGSSEARMPTPHPDGEDQPDAGPVERQADLDLVDARHDHPAQQDAGADADDRAQQTDQHRFHPDHATDLLACHARAPGPCRAPGVARRSTGSSC